MNLTRLTDLIVSTPLCPLEHRSCSSPLLRLYQRTAWVHVTADERRATLGNESSRESLDSACFAAHVHEIPLVRHAGMRREGASRLPGAPLVRALELLRGKPLYMLGDSQMRAATVDARCTLRRERPDFIGRLGIPASRDAPRLGTLGAAHRVARALNFTAQAARRSGGGMILVLIGDHYHDDQDGAYGLASLAEALEATLRILDDYAAACELCVAALATRTARHFRAAADGDWRGHTAEGCAPLPSNWTTIDWEAALVYEVARKLHADNSAEGSVGGGDGNSAQQLQQQQRQQRRRRQAEILPLHLLTQGLHDQHHGRLYDRDPVSNARMLNNRSDCLHYVPRPWTWEPLWYELAQVMERRLGEPGY